MKDNQKKKLVTTRAILKEQLKFFQHEGNHKFWNTVKNGKCKNMETYNTILLSFKNYVTYLTQKIKHCLMWFPMYVGELFNTIL